MTIDPEIRDRIHAAVDQDTAPPGLAELVVRRGRRRRARRYAIAGLAGAVIVGATSAAVKLSEATGTRSAEVAGNQQTAWAWARSLPEGPPADVPFFGEGGLHDGDEVVPVPDRVIRSGSIAPYRVSGGWLVLVGIAQELAPAVLSPDGSLRELPPWQYPEHSNDATVVASADGTQVAYGDRVLDLGTRDRTSIPRQPGEEIRLIGFSEEGLVYQLTGPTRTTTRLLSPDGRAVDVALPAGAYVSPRWPADVALSYPESVDECVVSWELVDVHWVERSPGCRERAPGRPSDVSPDGRWVLTDDLPEVWALEEGRFSEVAVPRATEERWGYPVFAFSSWESTDTFLIPVTDPPASGDDRDGTDSAVQLVRCTMSTGDCERAGEETMLGPDWTLGLG